jgi:hypothetical protein
VVAKLRRRGIEIFRWRATLQGTCRARRQHGEGFAIEVVRTDDTEDRGGVRVLTWSYVPEGVLPWGAHPTSVDARLGNMRACGRCHKIARQ